ncbi:FAD-binding oxidoreductase [Streptomyces platensis]|uniref:FAD-binding oxidoreductase n=1 Tax=Streptomyces platensis TaxID=58346 RepID=UPI0037B6194C
MDPNDVEMRRRTVLRSVPMGAAALALGAVTHEGVAAAAGRPSPEDLREALGHKVLFPGDKRYDEERAAFNTLVQHHPKAIVLAESSQDVETAVRIVAALGWPIAVQATGHGIGLPADGALLINMRKLNGVSVDPRAGTARVQGGAKWGDVVAAAAPLGLAPPAGTTSHVGATGYMSGGGVSFIGRAYGYAADRVRAVELVTPDGRRRHLSPHDEPGLFWAVRGGKSNFGAITSFDIDLLPKSHVYAGELTFPVESAAEVFTAYVAWTATVSDEMTSLVSFTRYPDTPEVPPQQRGKLVLGIKVVHIGARADADRELRPLRAQRPITDSVAEVPIARMDTVFQGPTEPGAIVSSSGLIRRLDARGTEALLRAVGPDAELSPGSVEIRQLGGRFAHRPATPNAIGHRDALFALFFANPAPTPDRVEPLEREQRALLARVGPLLTGGRLPNFLGTEDTTPAAVSSGYEPADWERLLRIKRSVDPRNLFRINHNIR